MLRVRNLHVSYGRIHALRAATIHVAEKEIVALLGGNGSGKTTLLSAISDVVRATSGEVALAGRAITRARPDQIVREGIAHVPEGRHIFKPLTVEDDLLLITALADDIAQTVARHLGAGKEVGHG